MPPALRVAALAAWVAMALAVVACGGGEESTPSPTPTPFVATSTPGTPTPAPAGSATPATSTATPTPAPGDEKPRVLWMVRDHGGTNLAVVRFATNVPTTAVLSLVGSPGEPTGVEPQESTELATEHTISIPLGMGEPAFLSLQVTDAHGAWATATLEYGDTIVGTQYWARAEGFRPAFDFTAPFKGAATWHNIVGATAPPLGSVQLFAKQAGCTTAQQCQAGLVATFEDDTGTLLEGAERHSIPVEFPATPEQDFQLLYTVIFDAGPQAISLFYQRDLLWADVESGD